MTDKEIVPAEGLGIIADVRTAIDKVRPRINTLLDAVQLSRDGKAAQAFFTAKGMEENAQAAKAVSLWAQRKAGEFWKEAPKNKGTRGQLAGSRDGSGDAIVVSPESDTPTLADLDIDPHESSRWQILAEIPEEQFEDYIDDKVSKGYELTAGGLVKIWKELRRTEARAEIAKAGELVPPSERWHVYHADMRTWEAPRQYDLIITDPPYPKEFLPLYSDLSRRSVEWLKPGGMLVAMSAHFWMPELYRMLGEYLDYFWTSAYLVPGETGSVFQKHINPQWKPLLMYQRKDAPYVGRAFADVFKSAANDKEKHKWGQSESGMLDIISKLAIPGQYILDPFCGAGTTGVAALRYGCLFDGVETELENVNISKGRLGDVGI